MCRVGRLMNEEQSQIPTCSFVQQNDKPQLSLVLDFNKWTENGRKWKWYAKKRKTMIDKDGPFGVRDGGSLKPFSSFGSENQKLWWPLNIECRFWNKAVMTLNDRAIYHSGLIDHLMCFTLSHGETPFKTISELVHVFSKSPRRVNIRGG